MTRPLTSRPPDPTKYRYAANLRFPWQFLAWPPETTRETRRRKSGSLNGLPLHGPFGSWIRREPVGRCRLDCPSCGRGAGAAKANRLVPHAQRVSAA